MKYRKMLAGLFAVGTMAVVAAPAAVATSTNAGGFKGMGVVGGH